MKRFSPLLFLFAVGLAAGCQVDTAPRGLRATPPGSGPVVRFDPTHRPLPDVPLPNDVATFPDPTSRTGLRIDASLAAPTQLERRARADFATLEGWGVTAPITVAFERAAGADPREPALDLDAIADRMEADEHDPSNDPFYVINLTTGIPVLVDVGSGHYPVVVRDPYRYGTNDPKASEPNLIFETVEEGAGLPQIAYRPDLDRDFDGVLDHPNTLPRRQSSPRDVAGVDDLLTWYERETDTLVLRPIVPLEEKTEYAVVLTDRLRGPDGQPVRSPFEAVFHPAQRAGIARLNDWLTDKRLASYYGDIAGTGLEHVAFAWTFTTQPTHEDLRLLREGLHGKGPFARWKSEFAPEMTALRVAGTDSGPACERRAKTPFALRPTDEDLRPSLRRLFEQVFGLEQGAGAALDAALEHVDHVVVGTFRSPYLLGDPSSLVPDARFHVSFATGEGDVRSGDVSWILVVPKATAQKAQPFPVALWGHGAFGHADEALLHAGDFARQGIALVAYDAPGHGRVLGDAERAAASSLLVPGCVAPFLDGLTHGRPRAVDGSASWSAHLFRTRDTIRQGVLDGMNLVRILRSFDGRVGAQDVTGDGKPDVAGDFDGNGVPDVGGPNVPYFTSGESLGGAQGVIQGAVDPHVIASAPISGGGGLATDIAFRSFGLESITAPILGPAVFAVPASERPQNTCAPGQRAIRLEANDGGRSRELELACVEPTELAAGMTVVVTNVATGTARCARTDRDGRFRIPIPTTAGDRLDVQVYPAPDVVASYDGCHVKQGAPVGRRIRDLVAASDGLGLRRQSPELRRIRDLAQAALDPADPVAFAPHYMLEPLFDEEGRRVAPHALLAIGTVGDAFVPIATNLTLARAAGALPFLPPNAAELFPAWADYATPAELYERLGRKTPMRLLVERGVVEGVARLGRTSAGPGCKANHIARDVALCAGPATIDPYRCATALYDPDWVSEGRLPYDAPHAEVPLRLARVATVRPTDSTSLAASWAPRLRGVPSGPDEAAWSATERVVGVLSHYVAPEGAHAWTTGDACRAWDFATYGDALVARFFASGGKDVFYLSHPRTHGCLVDGTCDFFR